MIKNNSVHLCFIVFILLASVLKTNAQTTVWTLNTAIEDAKANRKSLLSLKTAYEIHQLKTKELNAKYLPRVSFDYKYQYNPIIASNIIPVGEFNSNLPTAAKKAIKMGANYTQRTGVIVQQPLLDLSISKLIKESKLQEKLAILNEKEAVLELTYEVKKAYFNVLLAEEQIKRAVTDTIRTELTLSTVTQKYRNQRVLKADLNDTQVTHNNTIQKYHNAVNNALILKQYLLYLTGKESAHATSLELEKFSINGSITAVDENLIERLPQIEMLKTENEVLQNKQKMERIKHNPIVSFDGYLGADQFADNLNPFKQNSWYGNSYVGVSLKFPILFGENSAKRIQQLKFQQEQNNYQIIEEVNKQKYNALNASTAHNNTLQQLKTVLENCRLTSETLAVYKERYTFDQISLNELNDKEIQLQNLKLTHSELQKELLLSWLDWKKATGNLK
jgi:outer membrane protein